jgi:hypothetical protein
LYSARYVEQNTPERTFRFHLHIKNIVGASVFSASL